MKLYLAGEREGSKNDTINIWRNAKRRLFSYYYHGYKLDGNVPSVHIDGARHLDLFLDSGAFTAFTKKETIDPERYADFVKKTRPYWSVVSSLDVIGEGEAAAKASYDVFRRLLALGAEVIPVFHVREPDHWLQRYLSEGHTYLAIGGMVPEETSWLMDRLDGLWGHVLTHPDGRPKVQVHGFGLTTKSLMFRYPWYSVDSTSWLMHGVYGGVLLPIPGHGYQSVLFSHLRESESRKMNGWHFHSFTLTADDPRRRVLEQVVEKYGVTVEQLAETYQFRDMVNAAVYQELEQFGVNEFHIKQPVLFE
jgi:hypothetical protein